MKAKTKQTQLTNQQRAVQAFFRALRKTRSWGWKAGEYIRTTDDYTCCPIVAVGKLKFPDAGYSGSGRYLEIGRRLGLRARTADAIATGADSRFTTPRGRRSAAARYRQQILKALGLKEVAA